MQYSPLTRPPTALSSYGRVLRQPDDSILSEVGAFLFCKTTLTSAMLCLAWGWAFGQTAADLDAEAEAIDMAAKAARLQALTGSNQ